MFSYVYNLLNKTPELYIRTLVALCSMVLYHKMYIADGAEVQCSTMLPMATTITHSILIYFGLHDFEHYIAFLKDGDVFEWGEEVNIHDFSHLLYTS